MTRFAAPLLLTTAAIAAGSSLAALTSAAPPDDWVQQLGAESYAQRLRARHELLAAGRDARAALQRGRDAADLEIRKQSAAILNQIHHSRFETELRRMQSATESGQEYQLPGWTEFRRLVGDDRQSRTLFVAMTRCFRQPLAQLAGDWQEQASALLQRHTETSDPDPVAWALLLMLNQRHGEGGCLLNHHVREALNRTRISSALQASPHADVLRRLVAAALERQADRPADRIWMRIAVQWNCRPQAVALAERATMPDRGASPACTATALTILARFAPDEARPALLRALDDGRTCQVWQIVAASRRRLKTQVSDVALAMLLYLDGVDPRSVGFADLQADPLTIYREHSLGFEDDKQRQAALESASRAGVIPLRFVHPSGSGE
ncbi:hypothetical protein [Roseimaritima ulvae]|uniref:HEAT repeat protein n=1 Tax=Roseimaritima ulvae TaxID=980254 RepID=A0A5B9QQ43_9BACT|nr:hypothetical protein [Roseimaritima ulvae]QEG39780.1 hypothetical protein UC8_17780 [Roseimaritima ulvae]